jgi:hypothetical protein
MSEKVLLEFRAEEIEDGYSVFVKHDKEALSDWCPAIRSYFFQSLKKDLRKRMHNYRRFSKRRMRRGLNFYERMYEELYGSEDEGEA